MPDRKATASSFILPRRWVEEEKYLNHRQAVLNSLDGLEIDAKEFFPDSFVGRCIFSVRNPTPDEVSFIERRAMRGGLMGTIAIDLISSDFSLDDIADNIIAANERELTDDQLSDFSIFAAGDSLSSILNGCLSIWNICYFGCLNSVYHIAVVNDEVVDFGDRCEFRTLGALTEKTAFADVINIRITPTEALEWSKACSGYWQGNAETRIQRATACLLRTFSNRSKNTDTYSTLMWSLAGLEALYCNNESSIKYQIRNRAPLLVARYKIRDLDKHISRGYDFRSRLFHGDVKIKSPIAHDDDDYNDDRHHELQADQYADFFCLLLTCSVSAAIEEKSQEVFFNQTCQFC